MTGKFPYYFALTWLVFSIVLISAYSSRYLQTFLFLFLIFFAPYKPLFDTARMLMAGNMIAFLYLLFALFLILRVRLKVKLIICFLLTCFLVVGFYKFPAKKRINTIVNLKSTWALYTASVEIIARKKGNFKVLTIPKIRLYNPEGIDFPLQGLSEEHADEFVTHAKINAEIIEPPESESVMKASENLEVLQNRAYRPKGVEIFLPEPEATKEHVREEEHNEGFLMEENASPEIIEAPENEFFAHRKNNFNAEEFPTQQALKATKKEIYRQFGTPVVRTNNTSNLSQQSLIDRSERVPMVSNSVFRLLIWRDMFANYMNEKPFLGFDFGKPFRSISLEVLNIAEGEWRRDGWISPHSSYLYMIYRGGIIGFIFVIGIFFLWFKMAQTFIRIRSVKGILLCASLISWLMAANFSHVFELPYTAIPIWSLYGVVFGYWRNKMSILKMSTAERPDIDA
ncbi:MAG: O-antigen ligase family protein [Candidatus Omnitrophota bacterium]|nr:O-antigen ligase family protein [Candidatus Omnitrophota bacterium]